MLHRVALASTLLFPLIACQPSTPTLTDADRQSIASEIEQIPSEWGDMATQENLDSWMARFAEDIESYFVGDPAFFVQGLRVIPTTTEASEFFGAMSETRQSTNFTTVKSHVAVISHDMALQVIEQHWSITDSLGVTGPTFPLTATTLWVRQEGTWKFLHHHQTWSNEPIEAESEE